MLWIYNWQLYICISHYITGGAQLSTCAFCTLPSLCCGNSNCHLLASNRVCSNLPPFALETDSNCRLLACNCAFFWSPFCSNCHFLTSYHDQVYRYFSSVTSFCSGDSNHRLLVWNWACFCSLPSLKISVETPVVASSVDADACSPCCGETFFFLFFLQFCTLSCH